MSLVQPKQGFREMRSGTTRRLIAALVMLTWYHYGSEVAFAALRDQGVKHWLKDCEIASDK